MLRIRDHSLPGSVPRILFSSIIFRFLDLRVVVVSFAIAWLIRLLGLYGVSARRHLLGRVRPP
jgi:hypothetical protein